MSRSETPAPENPTDSPRFALLTEATMTPRQRESYQGIVSGPRKGARGPFNALLRSPEMGNLAQKLGEYLRAFPAATALLVAELDAGHVGADIGQCDRRLSGTEHLHCLLGALDGDLVKHHGVGLGRQVRGDDGQQMIEAIGVGRERIDKGRAHWAAPGADDQVDMGNFIAFPNQRFTNVEFPGHSYLHVHFVKEGENLAPHG